jgi:cell division protein FtsL
VQTPKGFALRVVAGLCLVLLFVWEQVQATRLGYRVEQARSSIQTQENRNAYLRVELQQFKSPARLMEQAKSRLGMEPATPASVVLLEDPSDRKPIGFLARIIRSESADRRGAESGR